MRFLPLHLLCLLIFFSLNAKVATGIDQLFQMPYSEKLKGKKIGLITNQTGVNSSLISTIELLYLNQKNYGYELKALFAPEHGLYGEHFAGEKVDHSKSKEGIPIYSLHGNTRRPSKEMLKDLNLIVFDIQDIGSRSYTYISTLFYVMEEAKKYQIQVLVLDRPNPLGGTIVDGPMMENEFRSFVGYIDIPYCHGMTVAELARYFNTEYHIDCQLSIIPMKGWKRSMSFSDTGLHWIPTSPNIPDAKIALYYPMTGMLGELEIAFIGIGSPLAFQVVAAPWIDGKLFTKALNNHKLQGVYFVPTYIKPYSGRFIKKRCQGALIVITDKKSSLPFQYNVLFSHLLKVFTPPLFKTA